VFITAATIALIIKAVAAIEIATAITVLFLNITQIIDWFKTRRTNIPAVDKTKIYFTLTDLLAAGNYNVVQGVFDTSTQRLGDVRAVKAKRIDAQLTSYHRHHKLVAYE
jgi:hypothetical protein